MTDQQRIKFLKYVRRKKSITRAEIRTYFDRHSISDAPWAFSFAEGYIIPARQLTPDMKNGDCLIDAISKQRYYAKNTRPVIVNNKPVSWVIEYQTEEEYNRSLQNNSTSTININSVSGNSIIGNQENVTVNIGNSLNDMENLINQLPISEQPQAQELLDELKKVESATHPVLVEGSLSKFEHLLNKHKDILIALGGWAVKLLIGK